MSNHDTLLSRLPQNVCTQIKVHLPDLKRCEPQAGKFSLDELKKSGVIAPAVLVSILGAKQDRTFAGHSVEFPLRMAAYVVTRNGLGKDKDIHAANICQKLLSIIPSNRWDEPAFGEARDAAMETLISSQTRDNAVSLWAVTWIQPVTFFKEEPSPLGAALYVSQSPAIGEENENVYEQIGGQT